MLTFVFCGFYWECTLNNQTIFALSLVDLVADLTYIHNLKIKGYNLVYN